MCTGIGETLVLFPSTENALGCPRDDKVLGDAARIFLGGVLPFIFVFLRAGVSDNSENDISLPLFTARFAE